MIESWQTPVGRPARRRHAAAILAHSGLWSTLYAAIVVVSGRPGVALALSWGGWLVLVLVNNAKARVLKEPFVFDDYDYFIDVVRHPKLFLPFLGVYRALSLAVGIAGAFTVLWLLEPPWARAWETVSLVALFLPLGLGVTIYAGRKGARMLSFRPSLDHRRFGLFAGLVFSAAARRPEPEPRSVWHDLELTCLSGPPLPHLVAVQCESFFDPRMRFGEVVGDVLTNFDSLKQQGLHGILDVPAYGANTVRSEYGFLSGISAHDLGYRKFQPYRFVRPGFMDTTLAKTLKTAGYRTVCVHPYHGNFYARDRVMAWMGFDEFVDLSAFSPDSKAGIYVGDDALASWVIRQLEEANEPLFVFVITMESHGPFDLHARADDQMAKEIGVDAAEVDAYLWHLKNADLMLGRIGAALEMNDRPGALCWFGDHPPALKDSEGRNEYFGPTTDYLLCGWQVPGGHSGESDRRLRVDELGEVFLQFSGLAKANVTRRGVQESG